MPLDFARIREADDADGHRVLVDRLWPRAVTKQRARLDAWPRELAPSTALRRWFHADPDARRDDFRERYRAELEQGGHDEVVAELLQHDDLLLLTDAKDVEGSHLPVLLDWLREQGDQQR